MKPTLITGMSGTGKSAVIRELSRRGYKAVDADCDEYSTWVAVTENDAAAGTPVEEGRDWVWREDRIAHLLAASSAERLFVSGCASNMDKFLPQFGCVILLSAPTEVIIDRLSSRTGNAYGKQPDELARVLDLIQVVEPLLRNIADHEINTAAPLDAVIEQVLRYAG